MFVRRSIVKRNGKTYQYAQIVESFRRPADGRPAHRVLVTLPDPEGRVAENMRAALHGAREGKNVVVAREAARSARAPKPDANLRYLELAVLLELWREWGLNEIFDELMPLHERGSVRPASVVAALTLQRCVDPGSKLSATRWFPRTSLVELLAVPVESFNNTRLHRVLDDLDESTRALMAKLPTRYEQRDGTFAALFMDVTDTWFVGQGCELAERGKTKEGMLARKIGIVLLCNEHGYPLRWEVIPGTQHDSKAMRRMMKAVAGIGWVGEAPLVCDRAMGHTANIRDMAASGVRFLTAVTQTEFDSYAPQLPHAAFADFEQSGSTRTEEDVKRAKKAAEAAGMTKTADNQFIMDFGLIERELDRAPTGRGEDEPGDARDVALEAMRLCREVQDLVVQGRYSSYAAAGRSLNLDKSLVAKYRGLRWLSEQQQRDILDGKLFGATLTALLEVAKITSEEERERAFEALASSATTRAPRASRAPVRRDEEPPKDPLRVRVAVYFNPERFVDERLRAKQCITDIASFAASLNKRLESPRTKLTKSRVAVLIDQQLRSKALLEAFDTRIGEEGAHLKVELVLKPAEWARRRRYDGFTVLVAHPELPLSAAELCRLYREKDAVEKDFQVIKSVVELRPVRHQTDVKVRAHVTLCMLALLLERTLRRRLHATPYSSERALEVLKTCHMNRYKSAGGPSAYTITEPDDEQSAILRALRLTHLTDDDVVAAQMTPR
jgi:transposase